MGASSTPGSGAIFVKASLRGSLMGESTFDRADFTDADCSGTDLHKCDLTGATFLRAKLCRTNLHSAKLAFAVLAEANLMEANLGDADLTGANLRGAELSGANLIGARIDGADFTGAKNWSIDRIKPPGAIGQNLRNLASVCAASKRIETEIDLDVESERVRVHFDAAHLGSSPTLYLNATYAHFIGDGAETSYVDAPSVEQAMMNLAKRWAKGVPRFDTLNVSAKKGAMALAPLRELCAGAWAEVFGVSVPGPDGEEEAVVEPVVPEVLGGGEKIPLAEMMDRLRVQVDGAKLAKALAMLRAERFSLYAQAEKDHLVGVVKSQSSNERVYSCRLNSDGSYSCCTQNLNQCGGLRGSICKHLLVLIVGLARDENFDRVALLNWVAASRKQQQVLDKEQMTATFLRYQGAEAGEIDWRPTETIPEDYYAL
jgi:hypothetical protein